MSGKHAVQGPESGIRDPDGSWAETRWDEMRWDEMSWVERKVRLHGGVPCQLDRRRPPLIIHVNNINASTRRNGEQKFMRCFLRLHFWVSVSTQSYIYFILSLWLIFSSSCSISFIIRNFFLFCFLPRPTIPSVVSLTYTFLKLLSSCEVYRNYSIVRCKGHSTK